MTVISPYLAHFWNKVLGEKGWNAKQLATASGVSYGYVRKIVNGTLIPSRDALRRMCAATGQDFGIVWRATHGGQVETNVPDDVISMGSNMISMLRSKLSDGPPDDGDDRMHQMANRVEDGLADLAREAIVEIMNALPLAGMGELLQQARELFRKYNPSQSSKS